MKRTPLKAKSNWKDNYAKKAQKKLLESRNKPKKRISKRKPKTIGQLKKELWKWFSKFIRLRDRNICFICGKYAEGSAYHAGHFIPKSVGGLLLYFHEDNVHGCCYHCNINLGGNLYEYGMKLGKEKCDYLYSLKGITTKWTVEDYELKIEEYKTKVMTLTKSLELL